MASFKRALKSISLFIFARFPFVNLVTLLMLLGERAERETYPPIEPKIIYGHLGVFLICGLCMGFNFKRKEMSLVHAGQLLVMAYTVYINPSLKYKEWVKIRMAHRMMGVAGYVLLYAYFQMPKPRSPSLRRIGETLIGLYLFCAAYSTMESPDDKAAFLKLVPLGNYSLYIYVLMISVCALCYLPGMYVFDVTQAMIILLPISTLFIDCNMNYWTQKRGMDFWNQVRLIADNVAIIIGAIMYVSCTKKKIVIRDDDETMRHFDGKKD